MVAEAIAREKHEASLRETAQARACERLQRELRQKMEKDVQRLHSELECWEDDCEHFRAVDGELLKASLHKSMLRNL